MDVVILVLEYFLWKFKKKINLNIGKNITAILIINTCFKPLPGALRLRGTSLAGFSLPNLSLEKLFIRIPSKLE